MATIKERVQALQEAVDRSIEILQNDLDATREIMVELRKRTARAEREIKKLGRLGGRAYMKAVNDKSDFIEITAANIEEILDPPETQEE